MAIISLRDVTDVEWEALEPLVTPTNAVGTLARNVQKFLGSLYARFSTSTTP